MMIDVILMNEPKYKDAVDEFNKSVRSYWQRNVGAYFNLRTTYWGLNRKLDHRISIASGAQNKTLRNALMIHWVPETGHLTIRPGAIMVKGRAKNWNLIDILVYGTRKTPMAYRVEIDARVQHGSRGAQDNDQWRRWMERFVPYVDRKLNEFADKIAEAVGDSLEEEIEEF